MVMANFSSHLETISSEQLSFLNAVIKKQLKRSLSHKAKPQMVAVSSDFKFEF
jgi:hypothetical protein